MKRNIEQIKTLLASLKNKYQEEGFDIVGIFGSYAKGSAKKYSDLDIAYQLDFKKFDEKYQGGFKKLIRIDEIKKDLQKKLHIKVDLVSLNSNNMKFKNNIKNEMVYV